MGWQPPKAKGPALAALASFYGKAQAAEDRYSLVVTVNDEQVYKADVVGSTEGAAVRVPRRFVKGAKNRVKFDIEGRGRYGYAVTLTGFTREFGPDQDLANKPFVLHRRVYWPDTPSIDGTPIGQGFGVAINPQTWENTVEPGRPRRQDLSRRRGLRELPERPAVVGPRLPRDEGVPSRPGRPSWRARSARRRATTRSRTAS